MINVDLIKLLKFVMKSGCVHKCYILNQIDQKIATLRKIELKRKEAQLSFMQVSLSIFIISNKAQSLITYINNR